MSGYGVPPGSSPAASRSPRSGPAVPMFDLIGAGVALLAFIFAFLPWAGPDTDVEGVDPATGWQLAIPTVATTLLLVAAALVLVPLLQPRGSDDASPGPALLAVVAALLYIVFVIVGGKFLGAELERKIGVWLGLVAGLAAAGVFVVSWMQKSGRMAKRPSPASYAPGQGGAPGGQWGGQQQGGQQGYGQQQGGSYGQPSYGQQQPSGYPGSQSTPPPVQQPPAQSPGYGQGYGQPGAPYGGGSTGPSTGGTPAQGGSPYGGGSTGGQDYPPASGYPSQGQGYPSQGGQSDYPR